MLERGKKERDVIEIVGIDSLVPADHLLRKIEAAVDFNRLYEMVEALYCEDNGRPSVAPVAQAWLAAADVHQSDAPGPTADIPAHPAVPEIVLRAGGGLRALGVDHQLLMVWVLIEAGGGGEKGRPLPVTARDLPGGPVCHLRENLGVSRHGYLLLPFLDQK